MMHFLPRMPGALRACLLILAALWAHVAWAATTEVTDALGRKVKITTPVQRVVINFNYEEFTAVAGAAPGPRWSACPARPGKDGARRSSSGTPP